MKNLEKFSGHKFGRICLQSHILSKENSDIFFPGKKGKRLLKPEVRAHEVGPARGRTDLFWRDLLMVAFQVLPSKLTFVSPEN